MSELRELTARELDAVGGGFLNNNNWGQIQFNNGGGSIVAVANTGNANGAVVGAQIGQQVNGIFSINGIVG